MNNNNSATQAEIAKKFHTIARLIESGQIRLSRQDDVTINVNLHAPASKFFGAVGAAATFLKGDTANASSYRSCDTWGNTALVKTDGLHIAFRNVQRG